MASKLHMQCLTVDIASAGLMSCLPTGRLKACAGPKKTIGARLDEGKARMDALEKRRQWLLTEHNEWDRLPHEVGDEATWEQEVIDTFNRLVQEYGALNTLRKLMEGTPRVGHDFVPYIKLLSQVDDQQKAEALYRHLVMIEKGLDGGTSIYISADNLPFVDAKAHSENILKDIVQIDGVAYSGASVCQLGQTGYLETMTQLMPRTHWKGTLIKSPREHSITGRNDVGRIMATKGHSDMVCVDVLTAVPYQKADVVNGINALIESFPTLAQIETQAAGEIRWSQQEFDEYYDKQMEARMAHAGNVGSLVPPNIIPFPWLRVPFGVDQWEALKNYENRFPALTDNKEFAQLKKTIAKDAQHYNQDARKAHYVLSGYEDWLTLEAALKKDGAVSLVLPTGDEVCVLQILSENGVQYGIAGGTGELWPNYKFRSVEGALGCLIEGMSAKPLLGSEFTPTKEEPIKGIEGVVKHYQNSTDLSLVIYGFKSELARPNEYIGCRQPESSADKNWFVIAGDDVRNITMEKAEDFFRNLNGPLHETLEKIIHETKGGLSRVNRMVMGN